MPRGTVHLLPTEDLLMWTAAFSALPSSVAMHPELVRFTPEHADEVIAAIGDALADAELTIDEVTAAIEGRTGSWAVEPTMDAWAARAVPGSAGLVGTTADPRAPGGAPEPSFSRVWAWGVVSVGVMVRVDHDRVRPVGVCP